MTDSGRGEEGARPIGRRALLGSLAASAVGIAFGATIQERLQKLLLPLTLRDPTGLSDLLPVAGRFRIYSVTATLPQRSADEYALRIDGLVDRPVTLPYRSLHDELPQTALRRDFQCVTGWRVRDVPWVGVRLRDVLATATVAPSATHVVFHSFDGTYVETLSMEQALRDDVLVAHTMLDRPVTREHGGPVRLYVAPMYGYKSCKWLERIEVTDHLPEGGGYWEQRGFDVDAWTGQSNGGHQEPT